MKKYKRIIRYDKKEEIEMNINVYKRIRQRDKGEKKGREESSDYDTFA